MKVLNYPKAIVQRKDKNKEFNSTLIPKLRPLPETQTDQLTDASAIKPMLTPQVQSKVQFNLTSGASKMEFYKP